MEALKYNFLSNLNSDLKEVVSNNSIVTITDSLGRIEYANNGFCEIMECDSNLLIGETHKLLKSHLHTDKMYKDLWKTIRIGEKWNGVLCDRSITGKQFWLDTTIIPVINKVENTTCYVSIYKNITETHLKNTQLIESNIAHSKYSSIYQSINYGIIVVTDSKGNITEWNKGAELAFGYTKVEILGYPLSVLIANKSRKGNIKELFRAVKKIKKNNNSNTIEMYCVRKTGNEFPVEFTLNTLNVDNKVFYSALMHDITKQKELETKLNQKTKDLELFLYRTAHDLKAPFSSAKGLLDLLKDEQLGNKAETLLKMLTTTINSGALLVNNLSKPITISNKISDSEVIDFEKIINHTISLLSGLKHFNVFKIEVNVDRYCNYMANPEWISSIFQNLIQNAIKYSKIPSKKYTPTISVTVKSIKNKIHITVTDNGQGIHENSIKNIFDLYYRSSKVETPGHGLGLYIVKNIVDDLEGEINVTSKVNQETCFEIKLPNL